MDPLTKNKKYTAKFPRNVIEDALRIFLEEAKIPPTTEAYSVYATIEEIDESWRLPSVGEFLSEYGKSITRGCLSLSWRIDESRIEFKIRFSAGRNGTCESEIDVTHLSRLSIEQVFKVFQDFSIQDSAASRGSTYRLEKALPSCFVTPKLLKKLEQLLRANVAQPLGSHTPFRPSLVEIRLTDSRADSSGSEILTTIDDYQREYFPDTIRRAEIGLGSFLSDDISIQFDRERTFTVLKVSNHSPTARADAIRVADQVLQIVGDHKNGNWFLNPPSLLKALLEILFYMSIGIGIAFTSRSVWLSLGFITAGAGLQVYNNLHRLKPYSEFHTRQSELISKWFNWFVFAAVEFILFSIFITAIIRYVYPQ
jgi:hypothetical protein